MCSLSMSVCVCVCVCVSLSLSLSLSLRVCTVSVVTKLTHPEVKTRMRFCVREDHCKIKIIRHARPARLKKPPVVIRLMFTSFPPVSRFGLAVRR